MSTVIVDIYDILPDDVDIDYERYWESEQNILNPALRELGYEFSDTGWYSAEADSFGPLTRALRAVYSKSGRNVLICYG